MNIRSQLKSSAIIALQGLTLYGLLGQLRLPDSPSYSSVNTNLLNPWSTWCTPPVSCYGTSWAHWGGPYSIMWYWINAIITLGGHLPYTPVLYVINLVIQFRLRHSILAIPWGVSCLFGLLAWPQNMIILQLLFLGFYSKWGTILAPLFKLPVGSFNIEVWNIAFNSHTAVRDPGNWFTYLWLAVLWFAGVGVLVGRGRRESRRAMLPEIESMPQGTAIATILVGTDLLMRARTEQKSIQGPVWEGLELSDDGY